MFGNNPLRKQDLSKREALWIQSIFPTIQGEGPHAGTPAIFVRLGGCNLKCFWCDTDFESSQWVPFVNQVIHAIADLGNLCHTDLVVLTGGEPFRQDISLLVKELLSLHYEVQIETNGILWLDGFEKFLQRNKCTIVCSPKTGKINENIARYSSAYKYIVSVDDACPEDGLPMMSTQNEGKKNKIARPPSHMPVFVQPLDTQDPAKNELNEKHAVELCMKYGYRLSYQIHKKLGLE